MRIVNVGAAAIAPAFLIDEHPNSVAGVDENLSQLESHPADTITREKLAVLYAEHFQRLDLAVDQLEQLIALPDETPKHVARWLNLLATLQINVGRDENAARNALGSAGPFGGTLGC